MNDKALHFVVGIAIAAVFAPFGPLAAALIVVVAALGKEGRDAAGHGTPEWLDAGATALGGLALLGWQFGVHYVLAMPR